MTDPEVGWRLEVANFEGSFPHSHTKLLVVDGKQAVSMGFNVEFKLMPTDHPSGKGKGDTDLGLHIIGPVAQDSRRAFDDLWDGAVRRHCDDFDPAFQVWQLTCSDSAASVDHVPEVMRYYDVDGDTTALSMFRNDAHDEADQGVYAIMDSVEESVDIMHVNFALPIECVVNHFFDVCRFDNALPYMSNWIDTIEEKGVKARVLLGVIPIQGVENTVAVRMLENEIDERGLNDLIEIRYKNGYIHAKTILVDDEFLVVGSQNLHAGAFGKDGGLTEYSLAIDNPQAIEEYKAYFQHYWDTAH
jgi:phosphatidylserine/phosphatidylglycerophosphate/cardiolipin synthase-like enzyme